MSKTDELFRPKLNAYTTSPFPLAFTGSFTIQTVEVPSSASSGESLRASLSQTEKIKGWKSALPYSKDWKSALPCTHGSVLRD